MNQESLLSVFPIYSGKIATLTTKEMIEVDRLMIETYHIDLTQMMENAGRALAIAAKKGFLNNIAKKVVVLAGTGGNGGGALVCARRLLAWGYVVAVYITQPEKMSGVPAHQLKILESMGAQISTVDQIHLEKKVDLIIDGIIGYSLQGHPHGAAKKMIDWANQTPSPILSLDTPSGLDLTEGKIHEPTIKASATLTLALPKAGLYENSVLAYRGKLLLADISVPLDLYAQPSLNVSVERIFNDGDIIELV